MSDMGILDAKRPEFDDLIIKIAKYVDTYEITSKLAMQTARYCLMDTLGCGLLALKYPACTKLLGPSVEGAEFRPLGAKIPGTSYQLEPIRAAFNIGTMIRWLDFNDTWLAAEWGHPSDNLGAIFALADYLSRKNLASNKEPLKVSCVLKAMIKAHEIQGILALDNCFNKVGLDHVLLVRVASSAVATKLLECSFDEILSAISHAFIDGGALRTYRHAPNTGSRKSWAAGDASSRGVDLALKAKSGEMGCPSVLSAKFWGYEAVKMRGKKLTLEQDFKSYVMENVLFKISFPAEFHAQTAVEAALILHDEIKHRLDEIEKIIITTQESAHRIINKTGPLSNPADRDHCIQYMVAIALIFGRLVADDYEDMVAKDARIDALRAKMIIEVEERYNKDYLDRDKRSIANALQVFFKDGTHSKKIEVEYPIGHKRRRDEGIPLLVSKFKANLATRLDPKRCKIILNLFEDKEALEEMYFNEFSDLFWLG
ncbi:2-methylcitrate dehydratase [Helicobacter suis]|uniref:2-methylcitrate dehydratase n=1 Tax=Helicobacter suis TaxID=104628 RepID=A0ABM7L042_9HELI|nr:2-methylcitrate dehydratase [Helicobacter suis]BCD45974.1 2-methylcitrate dehydratase [Helicobacter suis]BCD51622.1 2-methylcitrate dehydratase [Helicobacter suis]GFK16986.1 2-methylcitrate dehydratase [Helicobacter suis]